jgi:hypothetical protein
MIEKPLSSTYSWIVGDPAVLHHADVDRDDVPPLERVLAGDAVDDHRVGRRADRTREAAVSLEGGLAALGADEPLGGLVELQRGDARADLPADQAHRAYQDVTGRRHPVDLLRCLLDDCHRVYRLPTEAFAFPA